MQRSPNSSPRSPTQRGSQTSLSPTHERNASLSPQSDVVPLDSALRTTLIHPNLPEIKSSSATDHPVYARPLNPAEQAQQKKRVEHLKKQYPTIEAAQKALNDAIQDIKRRLEESAEKQAAVEREEKERIAQWEVERKVFGKFAKGKKEGDDEGAAPKNREDTSTGKRKFQLDEDPAIDDDHGAANLNRDSGVKIRRRNVTGDLPLPNEKLLTEDPQDMLLRVIGKATLLTEDPQDLFLRVVGRAFYRATADPIVRHASSEDSQERGTLNHAKANSPVPPTDFSASNGVSSHAQGRKHCEGKFDGWVRKLKTANATSKDQKGFSPEFDDNTAVAHVRDRKRCDEMFDEWMRKHKAAKARSKDQKDLDAESEKMDLP